MPGSRSAIFCVAEVPQVEVDVVLAADAAALVDLRLDGARGDVARRQLHGRGRVALP